MAMESDEPIQDWEDRVLPFPHLLLEWEAFFELNTDRQVGMDVGPIPWTSIERYAAHGGIVGPDEFNRFRRLVRAMDAVYLEWQKAEKPTEATA